VKRAPVLVAAITLAACSNPSPSPSPAATTASVDPAAVGSITGKIVVDGAVAPRAIIRLDGDPKCASLASGEARRAEDILVGEGNSLQNVFIYVKEGLPGRLYPVPSAPVVLDQQQCRYVPRVLGVQVGQQLTIRNSDPLLHNVRSEGVINEPFDVGTPVQGIEVKRTFVTREVMVPVKCNVHAWMQAYVGVVEHPFFAVSDNGGRFEIEHLPPGTYTIEIWHERLGAQTQQVTVAARETKDLAFTYKAS
jgi:plastocyanin